MPVDINNDIIDLKTLCRVIKERKKSFAILQIVVLAIVSLYLTTTPKVYQARVEIAPEISTDQNNNVTNMLRLLTQTSFINKEIDAIYPLMYPNVVFSDNFTADLFDVKVHTVDGSVSTTYYDYLKNHTRIPLWMQPIRWANKMFASKPSIKKGNKTVKEGQTVLNLSKDEERILRRIQDNTVCVVDRKMGILTLVVSDQDPLVCTMMADTIAEHLKKFIIHYRTNKARTDYKFSDNIYKESQKNYEIAQKELIDFVRGHVSIERADFLAKKLDLEQEVKTKRAVLESNEIQRFTNLSKIQENTPVFSIIRKPFLPNKATYPKVALTIIFSLLLANIAMLGYIFRKRLVRVID